MLKIPFAATAIVVATQAQKTAERHSAVARSHSSGWISPSLGSNCKGSTAQVEKRMLNRGKMEGKEIGAGKINAGGCEI